ncbi:hypothetical protein GSI_10634 [Ganoderma sinense ZZ0214-1]|uniref:EF-hand domain-containing protein n=1 Tax=Ganoderma sinense ZZ0214-1 TaxID=1077348 RepID=A0A2G8S167_9APHY|nr:hypothetical protein GSI_10634 [Ganoderma sinense ZZ0214-1]
MSEFTLPTGVSIHNTLGAAFIGNIIAAALYGLTTLQTYTYYGRSGDDPRILKHLIGVLWIFDTLHVVLISHTVYMYAVTGFGQVLVLFDPTWSVLVAIILTGTSDGLVRAIFCYRIWILSGRNWFVCGAVTVSSLLVLACSIVHIMVPFTADADADGFVSWQEFHSFIELEDISYAAFPHTMIYIAFYFMLPKLLLNSLLGTLNARRSLRDNISHNFVTIPLSSVATANREMTGGSHINSELNDIYPKVEEDDDMNVVQHAF